MHWRLLSRPCCPTITCNQREVAGMRAETVGCLSMPPRERLSAIRSVSSESGQTQSRNRWHWREPSRPSTVLQRRGDASRLSTPRHTPATLSTELWRDDLVGGERVNTFAKLETLAPAPYRTSSFDHAVQHRIDSPRPGGRGPERSSRAHWSGCAPGCSRTPQGLAMETMYDLGDSDVGTFEGEFINMFWSASR